MSGDPETFGIIGAAMEVHRHLGHGFLEAVYHEALCRELGSRAIPYHSEVALPIVFKGRLLATSYRVDLICYGAILVELKALRVVGGPEEAQVLNYLKAGGLQRALLLNFGTPSLQYRRFIWSAQPGHSPETTEQSPTSVKSADPSGLIPPGTAHPSPE